MFNIGIQKDIKNKNILISILNSNNIIEEFDLETINYNNYDYLFLNEKNIDIKGSFEIIYIDDFISDFFNLYLKKYIENYDYYYLKNSFNRSFESKVDEIIVGSSYSRKGIEDSLLGNKIINLSLPSQDLYYSCSIAEKTILNNKNIKKVFMSMGYYSFHNDLSKSKNGEINRIKYVYNPILKDPHNYNGEVYKFNNIYSEEYRGIINFDIAEDTFSEFVFQYLNSSYYNQFINRENTKIDIGEILEWCNIPERKKELYCIDRAIAHNKFIKYKDTFNENRKRLNSFVNFCNKNNIKIMMIIFPFSEFYNKHISKDMKNDFMEALNSIEGEMNFIDFNEVDLFDENDFLDMDHLNSNGAIKLTNILSNMDF